MFIDSHAHLQWEDYKDDFEKVLEKAKTEKVHTILNIGTTLETSKKSVDLATQYDPIFASIGIHPHDVKNVSSHFIEELKLLAKNPKVIAIGEIGLDFFYTHSPRETQIDSFEKQVHLAKTLHLPMSIHCRDAFKECFKILKQHSSLPQKGVFHCFTGTKEEAKEAIEMDFFISISGIVTFKKAIALQQLVKEISLEHMLIETDCPYLAPEPYRGKRNEPSYIIHTAKKISEIKHISLEEVGKITSENAKKLFQLWAK